MQGGLWGIEKAPYTYSNHGETIREWWVGLILGCIKGSCKCGTVEKWKGCPISYILHQHESCYTIIEKLALALVVAVRKLQPYFLAYTIKVLTDIQESTKETWHFGRMVEWAIEQSEFDIKYIPRQGNQRESNCRLRSRIVYVICWWINKFPWEWSKTGINHT